MELRKAILILLTVNEKIGKVSLSIIFTPPTSFRLIHSKQILCSIDHSFSYRTPKDLLCLSISFIEGLFIIFSISKEGSKNIDFYPLQPLMKLPPTCLLVSLASSNPKVSFLISYYEEATWLSMKLGGQSYLSVKHFEWVGLREIFLLVSSSN